MPPRGDVYITVRCRKKELAATRELWAKGNGGPVARALNETPGAVFLPPRQLLDDEVQKGCRPEFPFSILERRLTYTRPPPSATASSLSGSRRFSDRQEGLLFLPLMVLRLGTGSAKPRRTSNSRTRISPPRHSRGYCPDSRQGWGARSSPQPRRGNRAGGRCGTPS